MVPDSFNCTFFTVSPLVALELAERSNTNVMLIGGQLSKNSQISMGAQVINQLADIRVDLCLLGANAISLQDGITDTDWEVVQVKKAMIKSAQKTAILSIAEKLDSCQKMRVCNLNAIHYLITDLKPEDTVVKEFSKAVTVL